MAQNWIPKIWFALALKPLFKITAYPLLTRIFSAIKYEPDRIKGSIYVPDKDFSEF